MELVNSEIITPKTAATNLWKTTLYLTTNFSKHFEIFQKKPTIRGKGPHFGSGVLTVLPDSSQFFHRRIPELSS